MGACCSGRNNPPLRDYSYSQSQDYSQYQSKEDSYSPRNNQQSLNVKAPSRPNGVRFHHKILLVGKTGAGKSTGINMFVNLVDQKQYKDPRKIAITQKVVVGEKEVILKCNMPEFNNKQSDSLSSNTYESQTSEVSIYEVHGRDYDITLIDTPGLGDTKGTKVDQENIRKVVAGIQKLSEITCILYIHRSTDLRECSFLKYYVNQLKDLLPVEYKNNIVIGFTSAQNIYKIEAISVLKKADIPVDKYVCFENDCLMHPNQIPKSSDSQSYEALSKICWDQNAQQFEKFIKMIEPMKSQDTSILLDLFCKKQAIAKIIYQKQHKIDEIQQRKALNNQIIANIAEVKQKLQNSFYQSSVRMIWKTMKTTKTIKKYIDVELKEKVTFCFNCCSICHNPCYLNEIYNKGDVKIRQCQAFGCGSSDECRNCYHPPEQHGHSMKIQKQVDEEQVIDYEYVETESSLFLNQTIINNETTYAISQLTKKEDNLKKELKQRESEIERDTVFIAVLVKQIKDQSMNFNNQIIIDYIEEHIQKIQEDYTLTQIEKQFQLQEQNEQLEYYKKLEQEMQNAQNINLAKYNQPQLEREIKQLLEEETRIIKQRDFS